MRNSALMRELDGKYRILAEVGQGGTADVWVAVARGPSGFNKLVVLKSMKVHRCHEPELVRMFMNEARLAARLNHPNIVQTNEVFEFRGIPVIVMEYLDGQSFANVLARCRDTKQFPLPMQLRVISEALGGLHAAHELEDFDGTPLHVVHRDVSPHNIFITFAGQTKVLDFGIAKLAGTGDVTETGVIKGKLHYMPPEQITAEGVDRRADIYAMGVVLWEVAARRRMWKGLNEAVVMNRILNGETPDLHEVDATIPADLRGIVGRAMALAPDDRYQTAAEFQADLDDYICATNQTVRNRDLGEALQEAFEDVRGERKAIEAQLAKVASLSKADFVTLRPLALPAVAAQTPGATPPRKYGWRPLALAAVALSLLGAAAASYVHSSPAPGPVPAEASAAETKNAEVHLRVTAFPHVARLFLDEEPLAGNPYSGNHPRESDGKTHELRIVAPGYQTVSRRISFDQNHELLLTLSPEPGETRSGPEMEHDEPDEALPSPGRRRKSKPSGSRPPRPRARPTAAEHQASPAAKSIVVCDPPEYYDERGVKKFKLECLNPQEHSP